MVRIDWCIPALLFLGVFTFFSRILRGAGIYVRLNGKTVMSAFSLPVFWSWDEDGSFFLGGKKFPFFVRR